MLSLQTCVGGHMSFSIVAISMVFLEQWIFRTARFSSTIRRYDAFQFVLKSRRTLERLLASWRVAKFSRIRSMSSFRQPEYVGHVCDLVNTDAVVWL